MNDDQIPVLEDLISPAQSDEVAEDPPIGELELISDDLPSSENQPDVLQPDAATSDAMENAGLDEAAVNWNQKAEDEIRQILEKHMENAYEEIIRLLRRKD